MNTFSGQEPLVGTLFLLQGAQYEKEGGSWVLGGGVLEKIHHR